MILELDHFFILTEPGAPEGAQLVSLGIEESFSRHHEGQGTSNRRFPVSNSMLELLWVRDVTEAESGPARHLKFPERVNNPNASPFGLVFTRKADADANTKGDSKTHSDTSMPFKGWSYQPDFFAPPKAFHVGDNSSLLSEPLCIYVPFIEPVTRTVEHAKFSSITHVRVTIPFDDLSATIDFVQSAFGLEVAIGDQHLIEVTYNQGETGSTHDCRPGLPMIIHW